MTNDKTATIHAMRRRASRLAVVTLMFGTIAAPAAANGPMHAPYHGQMQSNVGMSMTVDVDRTHVLRLDRPASAVVVGNPSIADIAVHTTDTILVLGRNFGSTNIIAFDSAGNIMSETEVMVGESPSPARLRVYEGANSRKTFDCRGRDCLPTPKVGDDPAYRGLNTNLSVQPIVDTVVSQAGRDFGEAPGRPFVPPASVPSAPAPSFNPEPAFNPAPVAPSAPFVPSPAVALPGSASPMNQSSNDGPPPGFSGSMN